MTSQLQQAINLAQSLSFTEQLELLKRLSTIIQQTHSLENQITPEADTDFSGESFRTSWRQAVTGQTLPLSQLWEGIELISCICCQIPAGVSTPASKRKSTLCGLKKGLIKNLKKRMEAEIDRLFSRLKTTRSSEAGVSTPDGLLQEVQKLNHKSVYRSKTSTKSSTITSKTAASFCKAV